MRVNILGFKLNFSQNISIGEFFQELESVEDKETTIYGRTHIPYVDVNDGLIIGLVLSYKSNKKSLATKRDADGDLVVTKSTLDPNEHGTEVSVFCINPATLKGLIYSYTGALSPTGFRQLLKKQHQRVKRKKIKDYKNEITDFGNKNVSDIKTKIISNFHGEFDMTLLTTPSDLKQILSRFSEIDKVILRAENALEQAGIYTPIDPFTKKTHIQIDFDKKQPINKLKKIIATVFNPYAAYKQAKTFRLIGLAQSGEALELAVGENNDNFGKIDYDDYVELLPRYKWKEYTASEATNRLKKKIKELNSVFGHVPDTSWKILSAKDIGKSETEK